MYNFDLKKVHDLILFKNVCTTDNEYMSEASCLPYVEMETEPLYVMIPKMQVLFTPKLRYYKKAVENEINSHINAAIKLLTAEKTDELTKFILKKTRESVATLANESKRQLTQFDYSGNAWRNITSGKPVIKFYDKALHEYVVFLHYVIAELARCLMELQDRYADIIGEGGLYDVSLFYTSIVGRNPDDEFKLLETKNDQNVSVNTSTPKKTTRKPKGGRKVLTPNIKPMTLKYYTHGNKGLLQEQRNRVDLIFKLFQFWNWIDGTTSANDFDSIFEGVPRQCNITWKANGTILTILLQELLSQTYIEKQTNQSAKSMVKEQFGKSPNSDKKRLVLVDEERIKMTVLILDVRNPLEKGKVFDPEEMNKKETALREVFAGQLRSTKTI